MPFSDLLFLAQTIQRQNFDQNRVQLSRLLSIKTGGCPEDCGYCSQSAHYPSGLKASKLMEVERVVAEARKARDAGATRYCMGAASRGPKARDMDAVAAMIEGVKALGMETCMTLGMLDLDQAQRSRLPASTTTTTTSTPPSAITARSSRPGPLRTAWKRLATSARPASRYAAVASSAWARKRLTASTCWSRSPTCPSRRKACRSTC
ncbi:hypothetical protein MPL3356_60015 [Mesorhizobium plurifarium]|uniref:Radical SAM core domain-containing protein n=1 Tax=Mesorhizobium plurifarium TaxID=69974 RepID=A0A090G3H5_MESPL|nr:hypothetical protein MPL3356_60015 [Mesorhizobium plurifarium]